MRWDSGFNAACICGAYIAFTWMCNCGVIIWQLFGTTLSQNEIILSINFAAAILAMVIAIIMVCSPSNARRRTFKHATLGFLIASAFISIGTVIWMPYNEFSWETTAIITLVIFAISTLLAISSAAIRRSWYLSFAKKERREELMKRMEMFEEVGYPEYHTTRYQQRFVSSGYAKF